MRRIVLLLTLGAALAAGMPTANAAAAPQQDAQNPFPFGDGLRICAGGSPEQGSGKFAVEGTASDATNTPAYALTKILNISGTDLPNAVAELAENCVDIDLAPGIYRVTPGKYLSANCFKRPPFGTDATKFKFDTTRRCQAFVHHFHTKHGTAPSSTLEVPEVVVTVNAGEITEVDAHVVPVGYPECTDSSNPAANPDRVCRRSQGSPFA